YLELGDALAKALDLAARALDLRLVLAVLGLEGNRKAIELRLRNLHAAARLVFTVDGALQVAFRARFGVRERALRVRLDYGQLVLTHRVGELTLKIELLVLR